MDWPPPEGPVDFGRYFSRLYPTVGSWTLEPTIWTPCWLDAFPPQPRLCSSWGGYSDRSRFLPDI